MFDEFNSILKKLQREMEIILVADAFEHGWALIREMHNQLEAVDLQLQGMLMKVAEALKKCSKENRGCWPLLLHLPAAGAFPKSMPSQFHSETGAEIEVTYNSRR